MIGRSSDPEDALSSGGEYKKRSTSIEVTGAGIKASMFDVDNLKNNNMIVFTQELEILVQNIKLENKEIVIANHIPILHLRSETFK